MNRNQLTRAYEIIALMTFNTLMIFVVLNVGLWATRPLSIASLLKFPNPTRVIWIFQRGKFRHSRSIMMPCASFTTTTTDTEILQLLLEQWDQKFTCDEDALFRNSVYNGNRFVIDPVGFRHVSPQGPWPPDPDAYNIFVMGGSTTYGVRVAGNLTISGWLQEHLRDTYGRDDINIYNFGTPLHTSLQEFWRFRGLVDDGFVPDMVIFIDGLNEFVAAELGIGIEADAACSQEPDFISRIGNAFACRYDEACLPIQELAVGIKSPDTHLPEITDLENLGQEIIETSTALYDEEANRLVIERWLHTKQDVEAVADENGVEVLFIMQPTAAYAYDLQYHLLIDDPEAYRTSQRATYGYPIWDAMYDDPDADWTDNTLNLMHLGEDNQGPLYVTAVHYTADFSNEIAQAIRDGIVERDMIDLN